MTDENKNKKPFQVFQIYKVHTQLEMNNKYHHNNRTKVYDLDGNLVTDNPEKYDIYNPEFAKFNDYMDKESEENVNEKWQKAVEGRNINRKVQKNASRCFEFVFSASDTFASEWKNFSSDKEKWKSYFIGCRQWVYEKYGRDIVIDWAEHWDETTPHMHMLIVPVIELTEKQRQNPKNKGMEYKYSSSEFMHGRNGMQKLHTEFFEEVGQYYGLERGELNSRAKHGELKKYKSELKKEIQQNKELNRELETKIKDLGTAEHRAKRAEQWYEDRESRLCSSHESQIQILEKEAIKRFEKAQSVNWKEEEDIPEEIEEPEEDETAMHYSLRIKPAVTGFLNHCKDVVKKNSLFSRILKSGFNTEIDGKHYHFGHGLISEFKSLMSNLCKWSGQTPERFGAVPYNPAVHGPVSEDLEGLEKKYERKRLQEIDR